MTTLEKIATLAHVSRSTVSRVINNDPYVKEETRVRVKKVIDLIDYQPNLAARRLAGGQVGVIGLLVPMPVSALFMDPFFSMIIQGVCSAANALDHSVMLWLADPEYERRTIRHFLRTHIIDGAIIASMLIDDPMLDALLDSDRPFISVGRYPGNPKVSYVDVDNRVAAGEIISHLHHKGHRRIGTITGPINMIAGLDRFEGYKDGMKKNGLEIQDGFMVDGEFTEQGGYIAMQKLLPLHLDAVFIASDTMAVGALRAIKAAGLCVPDDIGMASFDDMPFAAHTDPPLTSMRQPIQRSGEVAVQALIELIRKPDSEPRHIILPTELMDRNSCGSRYFQFKREEEIQETNQR